MLEVTTVAPAKFRSLDDDHLEFPVRDRAFDLTHVLYYRPGTEEERVKYKAGQYLIKKKGKDRKAFVADDITPLNRQYGKLLCIGFKKGTLGVGKGDEARLISSDPEDKDYHPSWKTLIDKALPSAFAMLGGIAMNPTAMQVEDSLPEEVSLDEIAKLQGFESLDAFLASESGGAVQEGDDEPPLASSSGT